MLLARREIVIAAIHGAQSVRDELAGNQFRQRRSCRVRFSHLDLLQNELEVMFVELDHSILHGPRSSRLFKASPFHLPDGSWLVLRFPFVESRALMSSSF